MGCTYKPAVVVPFTHHDAGLNLHMRYLLEPTPKHAAHATPGSIGSGWGGGVDAPPAPLQPLPELINDALSMLYVFGLLLCFADAQKLSNGEEGSVATTSAFWLNP